MPDGRDLNQQGGQGDLCHGGGLSIRSGSGGAMPRASAGTQSVTMLMYRMAAGKSGRYLGPRVRTTPPITTTSVTLHLMR